MSPRAFDPGARARDFPRMPAPWRQSLERQVALSLQRADTAIDLSVQPWSTTRMERVTALPEPTASDIDRQVLLQLPGDTLTRIYVGVLNPDSTIIWQLMAAGFIPDDGGTTSPEFTFVGTIVASSPPHGVHEDAPFIHFVGTGTSIISRYVKSTGGLVANATVGPAQAIAFDTTGNRYLAQPASTRIRKYDAASWNTVLQTTPTAKTYNSLYHRPGASHLFATSAVNNQWFKLSTTTLAISNTVSTSISAPQGICEDSAGNVYVANSGANTIRKYNAALTFLLAWGAAGSGPGQFSTPKQMWVDNSDRIYVADSGNDRIQVFDTAGTFLGQFGGSGSGVAQLDNPSSVSVFGNEISVADTGNSRISRWTRT